MVGLSAARVLLIQRRALRPRLHLAWKVKGTIHWVPGNGPTVQVNLYDRLFTVADPGQFENLADCLNPDSLIATQAITEPALAESMPDAYFQFERVGFFKQDPDSTPDQMIYNRSVTLKDAWSKKH